ncbi:uncharacterized protein LOC133147087 [Syngnathus typhle]|uniref:uncharacterized protein LOC133147087 n=1 Tax=Syngnathus typhle TaxID=161592 RepID=UPI002A6B6781|nr:uncharacterized protein LOC133147087 [Syngnathus typhle]
MDSAISTPPAQTRVSVCPMILFRPPVHDKPTSVKNRRYSRTACFSQPDRRSSAGFSFAHLTRDSGRGARNKVSIATHLAVLSIPLQYRRTRLCSQQTKRRHPPGWSKPRPPLAAYPPTSGVRSRWANGNSNSSRRWPKPSRVCRWLRPQLSRAPERGAPACDTVDAFAEELLCLFDLGSAAEDAAEELATLRQGSRSVADNALKFQTLAGSSGWNEPALVSTFLNGLAEYMKDELVSRDRPRTLKDAMNLAARVDRRIRTRRRDRERRPMDLGGGSSSDRVPVRRPGSRGVGDPRELDQHRLSQSQYAHVTGTCPARGGRPERGCPGGFRGGG